MPVENPVFSGDQIRHNDFGTFYEFVNIDPKSRLMEKIGILSRNKLALVFQGCQKVCIPVIANKGENELFLIEYYNNNLICSPNAREFQ